MRNSVCLWKRWVLVWRIFFFYATLIASFDNSPAGGDAADPGTSKNSGSSAGGEQFCQLSGGVHPCKSAALTGWPGLRGTSIHLHPRQFETRIGNPIARTALLHPVRGTPTSPHGSFELDCDGLITPSSTRAERGQRPESFTERRVTRSLPSERVEMDRRAVRRQLLEPRTQLDDRVTVSMSTPEQKPLGSLIPGSGFQLLWQSISCRPPKSRQVVSAVALGSCFARKTAVPLS